MGTPIIVQTLVGIIAGRCHSEKPAVIETLMEMLSPYAIKMFCHTLMITERSMGRWEEAWLGV
ncbi:MAG: hypothetical protein IPJ20_23015 [Flammeovirgaceae bacterium]|nr:hypothetical protein [Flammeovirgaceae bacterium]